MFELGHDRHKPSAFVCQFILDPYWRFRIEPDDTRRLLVDPRDLAASFARESAALRERWRQTCLEARVDYRFATTDQPPDKETRRPGEWGQPHLVSNRLSVRGADLPIYLAIAWWLAPLFQLAMTADDAVNVRPAVPTMWIGGAVSAALLVYLLVALLRPERLR